MEPINITLAVAAMTFAIGALGVIIRRNVIVVFMCIELMLNSVNLSFVAFSQLVGNLTGQVAVFFVMVVAAAEAAVGLAIFISLFRAARSVDSTSATELRL
jgi:NADH-quinone oxidoreductase subunit K